MEPPLLHPKFNIGRDNALDPASAGGQIVDHLRRVHTQIVEVDQVGAAVALAKYGAPIKLSPDLLRARPQTRVGLPTNFAPVI